MPEAECPRCGMKYYGWALLEPKFQYCGRCGTRLKITIPGEGEVSTEGIERRHRPTTDPGDRQI